MAARFGKVAVVVLSTHALLAGAEAPSIPTLADPYERLRSAYAAGDATWAASAYLPGAVYTERQAGSDPTARVGRQAIEEGFDALFRTLRAVDPTPTVDLNFRVLAADPATPDLERGAYRLRIGRAGDGRQQTFYGRFEVARHGGLFARDTRLPGSRDDFEEAPGPLRFADDDEVLDPAYYDRWLGDWRDTRGCTLRVSRSMRRLYARDLCAGTWRAFARESGRHWVAGDTVAGRQRTLRLRFEDGVLIVTRVGDGSEQRFMRAAAPRRDGVRFRAGDVELAGVVMSSGSGEPARRPGFVLVHGSGPQDRHGYASVIDVIAQELVAAGAVVLAYDKRGVGGSQGDWSRVGFDVLAADARAAMEVLRRRPDVDPARVGFAGSSQAGWVVARALEQGARPQYVMLLGAAGTALSVREQNLYNTAVRMRCAGIGATDVELALAQQRAFFDARSDPANVARLDRASAAAVARPGLADWLFPADPRRASTPEWYDVLDPDYDPRPAWRAWRGRALFVFGRLDDSTPAVLAAERARADAPGPGREVLILDGAQHLGLRADSECDFDLERLDGFHADLWPSVRRWVEAVAK